jgi:hypothetical protein
MGFSIKRLIICHFYRYSPASNGNSWYCNHSRKKPDRRPKRRTRIVYITYILIVWLYKYRPYTVALAGMEKWEQQQNNTIDVSGQRGKCYEQQKCQQLRSVIVTSYCKCIQHMRLLIYCTKAEKPINFYPVDMDHTSIHTILMRKRRLKWNKPNQKEIHICHAQRENMYGSGK